MKIGDSVRAKTTTLAWEKVGVVVDVTDDSYLKPVLHVSFDGSTLAYGFTRENLEYADA